MIKILASTILLCFSLTSFAQKSDKDIIKDNKKYQKKLNRFYASKKKSPLAEEDRKSFAGIPFFETNTDYYVEAHFERAQNAKPFKMKTSGTKTPIYEVYGTATFELDGQTHTLNLYRKHRIGNIPAYADYLFIPFTDLTNGNSTYGGGRYIETTIPSSNSMYIDFNQAYNPYCAYATGYNCPIPPPENDLDVAIMAGVRYISTY